MIHVLSNLEVDEERMRRNIDITSGRAMSEAVMLALVKKGVSRQDAHEILRRLTIKSASENRSFRDVLLEDETIRKILAEKEIDEALKPENYLGTAVKQVEIAINRTIEERLQRGLQV
jgi:adenylosuccinate lyase